MARALTCLRVFIASPGGLQAEREAFRDVIKEYNDSDAVPRGVLLQAVGWEDTFGGIGRPQSIVNDDVRTSDFCALVLWNRWGSKPDRDSGRYDSGTEEEYYLALQCIRDSRSPMR